MSVPNNKAKRPRSENFCPEDEELLLRLVDERTNIIENKKQDAVCTQQKNDAWLQICDEFNGTAKVSRDVHTLRKKYGKIKMELRKRKADDRKQIFLTGGGVPKRSKTLMTEGLINLESALALSVDGLELKPYENESMPAVNRSKASATVTRVDEDETQSQFCDKSILATDIDVDSVLLESLDSAIEPNYTIWASDNSNYTILATGDDAQPTEKSTSPLPSTTEKKSELENEGIKINPIVVHTSTPKVELPVRVATNINPMSLRRPISKASRFDEKSGNRASKNDEAAEIRLQILQLDLQIVQTKLNQQNDEHIARIELIALERERAKLERDRAEQSKLNDARAHAIRMKVLKAELSCKMKRGTTTSESDNSSNTDDELGNTRRMALSLRNRTVNATPPVATTPPVAAVCNDECDKENNKLWSTVKSWPKPFYENEYTTATASNQQDNEQ